LTASLTDCHHQDTRNLEPTTLSNYRYQIEVHILPAFGHRALASITTEEVSAWEMQIAASGYSRRTARDARSTLSTVLSDAIPRYIQVNPAQRRRGKGRKGQRRIEHREQAEKVWATPLQVLLIAERLAVLTGRDEDFLLGITDGYTGMRWSETIGLMPDYVLPGSIDGDALDIRWKLLRKILSVRFAVRYSSIKRTQSATPTRSARTCSTA